MFTIALKPQRVIVLLSIGTQFSSKCPETRRRQFGDHSKQEAIVIPEMLRMRRQRKGPGARGQEDSWHQHT